MEWNDAGHITISLSLGKVIKDGGDFGPFTAEPQESGFWHGLRIVGGKNHLFLMIHEINRIRPASVFL